MTVKSQRLDRRLLLTVEAAQLRRTCGDVSVAARCNDREGLQADQCHDPGRVDSTSFFWPLSAVGANWS